MLPCWAFIGLHQLVRWPPRFPASKSGRPRTVHCRLPHHYRAGPPGGRDQSESIHLASADGQHFQRGEPGRNWSPLINNVETHLLMFNVRGDPNGRHNWSWPSHARSGDGWLAVAGLALALTRFWRLENAFALIWLLIAMLGGALSLSFEAPQSHRSIDDIVPAILFGIAAARAALGPTRSVDRAAAGRRRGLARRILGSLPDDARLLWADRRGAARHQRDEPESVFQPAAAGLADLAGDADAADGGRPRDRAAAGRAEGVSGAVVDRLPEHPIRGRRPASVRPIRSVGRSADHRSKRGDLPWRSEARRRSDRGALPAGATPVHEDPDDITNGGYGFVLPEAALQASRGVAAHYEAGSRVIDRREQSLDLDWRSAPPVPAPFSATVTAMLTVPSYGEYQLSLEGPPTVALTLDGTEILKGGAAGTLRLARGNHALILKGTQLGQDRCGCSGASRPRCPTRSIRVTSTSRRSRRPGSTRSCTTVPP